MNNNKIKKKLILILSIFIICLICFILFNVFRASVLTIFSESGISYIDGFLVGSLFAWLVYLMYVLYHYVDKRRLKRFEANLNDERNILIKYRAASIVFNIWIVVHMFILFYLINDNAYKYAIIIYIPFLIAVILYRILMFVFNKKI